MLVNKVARAPASAAIALDLLRQQVLAGPENAALGSEAELLARFGISRPTFRQVARVLEQEGLLTVRRGIGGGYYGRHPSFEHVGRASSNYLRSRVLTLAHIYEMVVPLAGLMAHNAASSQDAAMRDELAELRRGFIELLGRGCDSEAYLELARKSAELMLRMSGNPLVELQMAVLYQLVREKMARDSDLPSPENVREFAALHIRLAGAVLAHETEIAVALSRLLIRRVHEAETKPDTTGF